MFTVINITKSNYYYYKTKTRMYTLLSHTLKLHFIHMLLKKFIKKLKQKSNKSEYYKFIYAIYIDLQIIIIILLIK